MEHGHCRDLLDALSDYLDGEASAEVCREIQLHMGDCEKCRIVIDTLRMTVELYRTLPAPQLDPTVREKLYRTLDLSQYFDKR
jgi:predicted anti-sigma-YlaC factor YlaD